MKRRTDEKMSQTAGGDRAATLTAIPRYQRISDDLRERVRRGECTPDAWIKTDATKIGYEVSFTRHFYKP